MMKHCPPLSCQNRGSASVIKIFTCGMEKLPGFVPEKALTAVMVAAEADPLAMVTVAVVAKPKDAWNTRGFGFASYRGRAAPLQGNKEWSA